MPPQPQPQPQSQSQSQNPKTTESKILTSYLLTPAPLPSIISLSEFASLFPKPLQARCPTSIRTLYRDLQQQRNGSVDVVTENIEEETRRAGALRRAVIRTKREAEAEEYDDEVEIERMLFGAASDSQNPKHSINSIIPDLEGAVGELESEIARLEQEEAALMAAVQQTVGGMSDLRYGRLGNSQLREQVLDGLADLHATCKKN